MLTYNQALNVIAADLLTASKNIKFHATFTCCHLYEHIAATNAAYKIAPDDTDEDSAAIRSRYPDLYIIFYDSRIALYEDLFHLSKYITAHYPGAGDDTYFDYMPDALDLFLQMVIAITTDLSCPINLLSDVLLAIYDKIPEDDETYPANQGAVAALLQIIRDHRGTYFINRDVHKLLKKHFPQDYQD